jgi:hypothetical protein
MPRLAPLSINLSTFWSMSPLPPPKMTVTLAADHKLWLDQLRDAKYCLTGHHSHQIKHGDWRTNLLVIIGGLIEWIFISSQIDRVSIVVRFIAEFVSILIFQNGRSDRDHWTRWFYEDKNKILLLTDIPKQIHLNKSKREISSIKLAALTFKME